MNALKFFFVMLLMLFVSTEARAWNCNNPLSERVAVGTTRPSGTAGDNDGQWFLGTGTEGMKGVYYVCKQVKPKDPTKPTSTLNQTQSQSQTSTSTSASKSDSSSTATGGTSVLKNAGNSTLTNSGNSSNTNTNTATGGQGGSASSTASAQNNGNGSNNTSYNSTTDVEASKIPVSTAIALAPPSNLNCSLGYGAGVQTSGVGASVAFSKVDKNCAALTTALVGKNRLTFCKVYITNKYAKKAGVTLEDCLGQDVVAAPPAPVVPVIAPAPAPEPSVIVVPVTVPVAAPAPAPAEKTNVVLRDFGSCNLFAESNVCKAKIRDAVRVLINTGNGKLILSGPVESGRLIPFIKTLGIGASRVDIKLADDQNSTLTVQAFTEVQ